MTEVQTEEASESICQQSHSKLSQLHTCLREHLDDRYLNRILDRNGNIDYQFSGRTALHLALSKRNVKAFNLLLNRGANFTITDSTGSTVLHRLVESRDQHNDANNRVDDSLVDSLLNCHLQFNIHSNPRNQHGISHLHAACIADNPRAVEFLLDTSDTSINEAVYNDSPLFPGYTPLHFASRFGCSRALEILLDNDADLHVKDARGMTALHLLLERNLRLNNSPEKRRSNEAMINLLLENDTTTITTDHFGWTKLHIACATTDTLLVGRFLKHVAHDKLDLPLFKDSPIAPGFTALHLAANLSLDTTGLLLIRGADLLVKDANGVTPFDVCLERYDHEELRATILQCQTEWNEIKLSDGKTKLLDFLLANTTYLDVDVNSRIAGDSPLWPNYTPLHVAVLLYHKTKSLASKRMYLQAIRECLSRGADVTNQINSESTVVHMAFQLGEVDLVNLLLKHHKNLNRNPLEDDEGWTHLHIACALANLTIIEKLVQNGVDINGKLKCSGSTPLHLAVIAKCYPAVNFLLKHGADPCVVDNQGLTSIHHALIGDVSFDIGQSLLLHSNSKECVIDGLTHLHVACYFNVVGVVKKLLMANCSSVIRNDYVPKCLMGMTPLRLAIRRGNWELAKFMVQSGVKVSCDDLLEGPNDTFYKMIIRKKITIDLHGEMSLLHIGCKKLDVRLVKKELNRVGVDVNERMEDGRTALHLLMAEASERFMHDHRRQLDVDVILKELLAHGADVTMMDDAMQTPLHLADKMFYVYMDQPSDSPCGQRVTSMLRSIQDFSVNPIDVNGISHFHIACSWNDTRVVEEFLRYNNVEVNGTINHFADRFAGCTALHLTLSSQTKSFTGVEAQLSTVELLLRHGANVNAEDSRGNTPMHTAAKYAPPREVLFDMLVRAGADMNAKNIYGETPLEILLKSKEVRKEEIEFFLSHGCRVNDFNPISRKGFLPMTFSQLHHDSLQTLVLEAMLNSLSIGELNETGCTAIHNVVSTGSPIITDDDYTELIERLIKLGCDIDRQDESGKTALHVASQFQNDRAIRGLLSAGADINAVDSFGKPAFAYSLEPCQVFDEYREGRDETIKRTFSVHVHKMQLGKLDVSPVNKKVQIKVLKRKSFDASLNERFQKEIETMKEVKIGSRSLLLHDFMSETRAVIAYPNMTFLEREAVDEFFESSRAHLTSRFGELAYLLRLQYRKALARYSLMESAKNSLNCLTGIPLPDPCAEAIFVFLKNSELKCLIESSYC